MNATAFSMDTDQAAMAGQLQMGVNGRGHWVVRDAAGRRGGVFTGQREAMRFALSANGHRPDAIVMVPWVLELMGSAEAPTSKLH